jgi:hypothetical protein
MTLAHGEKPRNRIDIAARQNDTGDGRGAEPLPWPQMFARIYLGAQIRRRIQQEPVFVVDGYG